LPAVAIDVALVEGGDQLQDDLAPMGLSCISVRSVADVRDANLSTDRENVARLWLDYLTWGNDGLETRYGFRLPVEEAVERDLDAVAKFQPPAGKLLLAFSGDDAIGTAALQRIASGTAEIKRMWVDPSHRHGGLGGAMLDSLIEYARASNYERVRLDSPDFMTAAHALYRARGFTEIGPYAESEIPDEYRSHWVFMELGL
jgi:GNAT superfamily N-acetyltransferase